VFATGLGKTWLAAFDTKRFGAKRVLFVAHREEILRQALETFRAIRPDATLGLYTGAEKAPTADVLFASIQTLGKAAHLRNFASNAFDYLIIDEFHHAAARTYRRVIDYFEPEFLLGLTATPERTEAGIFLDSAARISSTAAISSRASNRTCSLPFTTSAFPTRSTTPTFPGAAAGSTKNPSRTRSPPRNALKTSWSSTGNTPAREPSPSAALSVMRIS
jgi:hypothetical protein